MIIKSQTSDREKYCALTRIVDGERSETLSTFTISLDNFEELKFRLNKLSRKLATLGRISATFCKLCSAIEGSPKMHTGGCPRIFNHCFKCIGRHAASTCSEGYFQLPAGCVCWSCWLPLQSTFGVRFHSDRKEEIGAGCSNPARGFIKELAIIFFHNRQVAPSIQCSSRTKEEYTSWLFQSSSAGERQLPNIILLVEAAMR